MGQIHQKLLAVQPCVKVELSAVQVLSPNTWEKVEYDVVNEDNMGWWSAGSYRYIPRLSGQYLVIHSVYLSGAFTANIDVYAAIYRNGGSIAQTFGYINQASAVRNLKLSAIISMNGSTDYLEGWAHQADTGNDRNIQAAPIYTFLHIIRMSG